MQDNDGGWFDDYGNWVYEDGSYFDTNGVYYNADGTIWADPNLETADEFATYENNQEYQKEPLVRQDSWGAQEPDQMASMAWSTMAEENDREEAVGQQSISPQVINWVNNDVWEVNQCPSFWAAKPDYDYKVKGIRKIRLQIGFHTRDLQIEMEQARAWAIDPAKRIVVELVFPSCYWKSTDPITSAVSVTVGQPDSKDESSVLQPIKLSFTLANMIKSTFFPELIRRENDGEDIHKREITTDQVKDLMETTYRDYLSCLGALRKAKGNEGRAISLLTDPLEHNRLVRQTSLNAEKAKAKKWNLRSWFSSNPRVSNLADVYSCSKEVAQLAVDLHPESGEAEEYLSSSANIKYLSSMVDSKHTNSDGENMHHAMESELAPRNHLVAMLGFLSEKIVTCNNRCLTCDKEVKIPGLKPSICGSELCRTRYEQIGLGFSLEAELRDNPDIVDLLISAAYFACSRKRMSFAAPYDVSVSVVDEESTQDSKNNFMKGGTAKRTKMKELHFLTGITQPGKVLPELKIVNTLPNCDEVENINYALLAQVLNKLPSVAEMHQVASSGQNLRLHLEALHPLLFVTVRWIIISNKAHIRKLNPEEQITEMNTDLQFVLLSSTPEREQTFRRLRNSAGSIWAWHGSAWANWHNILRIGLKNMSNTKYMSAGAAHGPGIYLAKDARTSLGYCRNTALGWPKSRFKTTSCLALCEMIDKVNAPKPYYVVQQENYIVTRFLFLVQGTGRRSLTADAMTLKRENKIPSLA